MRDMIQAGQLDRRIRIEQVGPDNDDGLRVNPGGWIKVRDCFASIEPLSGAERIAAGERVAVLMRKFRIRRPRGFTIDAGSYRILYPIKERIICDITEVREAGRAALDIMTASRGDLGPDGAE